MIAALNKATRAAIPVDRGDKADNKVVNRAAAVIKEARDNSKERVQGAGSSQGSKVSSSKVNKVNKVNSPIVTASKVSRGKLPQAGTLRPMMMIRTQNNQADQRMRILTAEWVTAKS